MDGSKCYENYPWGIVLVSNTVTSFLYLLGIYVTFRLNWILSIIYFIYVMILEFRLLKYHCTDCYYFGKICGFGKGKVSSLFFKKGDDSRFCLRQMTWKDMIPDMLVPLVPFVTGVVLLIVNFDIKMLLAVLFLVFLATVGNSFVRGSITCKYCEQKTHGCPADILFNKKNNL